MKNVNHRLMQTSECRYFLRDS